MNGRDCVDRAVVELRAALVAAPPLEQPYVVPVERSARCELPGDRQVRVDRHRVRDRRLLEVEGFRVFAAVRDLEDATRAAVVQQERLVSLAAEECGIAFDREQRCGDLRSFVGREAWRRRIEDGTHESMVFAASRIRRAYPGGPNVAVARAAA